MKTNTDRKNGLTNMKLNFLQKQTSRREMLRYSVTFAGSVLLAHLFSARLLRAATEDYAQQSPSAADLLASMRAKFNAVPMETQKLADNITMFDGPGGAVVVLNGPDGKFMWWTVSFCPPGPSSKRLLMALATLRLNTSSTPTGTSTIPITTRIFTP